MSEVKCPRCSNEDQEKIVKQKEIEDTNIYQCNVCKFRWGIRK